jgi:maltooligosyltrehalose trehalohydrolase
MSSAFRLARGAEALPDGSTRFAVWAPAARRVEVRIAAGTTRTFPLEPGRGGEHAATVAGVPAGTDYFYRLDGGPDLPDPVSRFQPCGVHGPSRVVDPRAFEWKHPDFPGRETADLILYELHVGTFTAEGTFDAVIPELPDLRTLGVTAIEIMPVAEFPGGRNWGYDGVHPYAPQSTYGGPDGLRRLVDAAHGLGLAVILDVVYNHLGPEGNTLAAFGPYFTDRHRTPWGPAINFDGPGSAEVRRYFIDNALAWIAEYRVDGLRIDAVHAIFDFGPRHILAELAEAAHAEAARAGRKVAIIAESDPNARGRADAGGLARRGRASRLRCSSRQQTCQWRLARRGRASRLHGLDGQWNNDFHHAVHTALTPERTGYYADFEGVRDLARVLRGRFAPDGRASFVVYVQNHDQVGNRARGDRLASLVPEPALRLAAAVLLLSPHVPLLFMGEEYGETTPFLYFVSHADPALRESVRAGRLEEFRAFRWEGEIPDPGAEATFLASRLDRARDAPERAGLRALYADLLALRRAEPLLRPGGARVEVECGEGEGWITLAYRREHRMLLAAFNFAEKAREIRIPRGGTDFEVRLHTEDTRYGGSNDSPKIPVAVGSKWRFGISATSAVLFEAMG